MAPTLQTLYGAAEHHEWYGVLIYDPYPDMRLFHSRLRGDFPSRWLQLLQWPLVSLLDVPDRVEESLMLFMNFLVHLYTCCSDKHASPYWTFICRWISMDRILFFFGACCKQGRHLYTTTAPSCCIPASHCHLLATLQTMSIIVVNLQDNWAVFRIFIPLLRFSVDSPF